MGMFDNATFNAPNLTTAVPSLENFLNYKKNHEDEQAQRQMQFEKDMANFHSQLKLKEMSQAMDEQRIQKSREPLNVLPPVGLITPAMDKQFELASERNKHLDEYNMQRNQIAQQNADTKRDLGEENIDARRDIAGQTLSTRKEIAANSKSAFPNAQVLQTQAEGAKEHLEGTKQENRSENLDTRGKQIINAIHTRGEEDRLTKGTESPNTTANIPTQRIADEKLRANSFRNANPDLAQWVQFDPNTGLVTITPPSTSTSMFGGKTGPSPEEHRRIMQSIYGQNGTGYTTSTPNSGTPNTAPSVTPTAPTGKVRVEVTMPDGTKKIGYMSKEKANQPGVRILSGGQ